MFVADRRWHTDIADGWWCIARRTFSCFFVSMFKMLFIAAQPFILITCPVLSVESRVWRLRVSYTTRTGGRKGDSKDRDVLCSQSGHWEFVWNNSSLSVATFFLLAKGWHNGAPGEWQAEGHWSGLGLVSEVLFYGSTLLRTGVSLRPRSPSTHGSCEVIILWFQFFYMTLLPWGEGDSQKALLVGKTPKIQPGEVVWSPASRGDAAEICPMLSVQGGRGWERQVNTFLPSNVAFCG